MPRDIESITNNINQQLRRSVSVASSAARSASKSPSPESVMISELKKQVDLLSKSDKSSTFYSRISIVLSALALLIAVLTFIFSFVIHL